MKSHFFKCSCSAHALEISKDEDFGVLVAIWFAGRQNKMTLKEKFRWIYRIIRHGDVWGDTVCLEGEELAEFKKVVDKL